MRFNFEFNLGDFDKEGSLNKWIEIMFDNGYQIYLFGDVKFFDNLFGGGLDLISDDVFNMYNYEIK